MKILTIEVKTSGTQVGTLAGRSAKRRGVIGVMFSG
jgi:hypothetical protein